MEATPDLPWEDAEAFVLRRLSLRNLRVLSALSEGGGLTAAAERLHVTQPAVSKALTEMERDLGLTLFARRGRNIHTTPVGDRLVQLARRIDQELRRAGSDVGALVRGAQAQLVVGATNAALPRLLPIALRDFKAEFPQVTVSVRTNALPEMWEGLRQGRLDLVVSRLSEGERPRDLRAHPLGSTSEVAVISLMHPLASQRRVDWPLLAQQAWLWPLPGTQTRMLQDRWFQRQGLALPSDLIETGDLGLQVALLRTLPRVALLPQDSARLAVATGAAKMLPLSASIGLSDIVAWQLPQAGDAARRHFLQLLGASAEGEAPAAA